MSCGFSLNPFCALGVSIEKNAFYRHINRDGYCLARLLEIPSKSLVDAINVNKSIHKYTFYEISDIKGEML